MITRIALEGIDGAGKTSVCNALAGHLSVEGYRTQVYAPFRLANERLGEDIYNLWFDINSCLTAICLLKDVIDDCENNARREGADVVVYDRHWMTALKMIEGRDTAEGYWGSYGPELVPVALLRVPVETALERRADEATRFWTPYMDADQMGLDAAAYHRMTKTYRQHLLGIYRSEDDVSPEDIARNIAWDMQVTR